MQLGRRQSCPLGEGVRHLTRNTPSQKERILFHHVKDLQFDARVSGPDVSFARLLLEQFGGGNGELKAAMQYFVQAFGHKRPHPAVFDMLMDIATEEFSHLEIVGATITMLLEGVNGELKDAVHKTSLAAVMNGKASREELIHEALTNPAFLVSSGGGPTVTDCNGVPWSGSFVNSNGDLTVDLRSNIAAESRAKITYEYLMQFTDDPLVKESLNFLMTREITHFQMFSAALETVQPNSRRYFAGRSSLYPHGVQYVARPRFPRSLEPGRRTVGGTRAGGSLGLLSRPYFACSGNERIKDGKTSRRLCRNERGATEKRKPERD